MSLYRQLNPDRTAIMAPSCPRLRPVLKAAVNYKPLRGVEFPITEDEALAFALDLVGTEPHEFHLTRCIDWAWVALARSDAPVERLSYERLITALCFARGLSRHDFGRDLATQNAARFARDKAAQKDLAEMQKWIFAPDMPPLDGAQNVTCDEPRDQFAAEDDGA